MRSILAAGLAMACGLSAQVSRIATIAIPAETGFVLVAKSGKLIAAPCRDKKLHLWSLPDGKPLRSLELGDRVLDGMALSEDARWLAAGDHTGAYTVWDTSTGAVHMEFKLPFYPAAIAFTPDAKRLAIAPVGEPVQIYDLASHKKLLELQRPVGGTAGMAFSRDGARIVTADADTLVRVYNSRTGDLLSRNAEFLMEPLTAAFTADGRQVLTSGGDKVIALLDAATGKSVRRSGKLVDPPVYMETSPDGAMFAAVLMHADNMLQSAPVVILEVATGKTVQEWKPETMAVGGAWTMDGHLLAVTATGKAIDIWRVR